MRIFNIRFLNFTLLFITWLSRLIGQDNPIQNFASSVNISYLNSPYYDYKKFDGFISFKNSNWTIISEPTVVEESVGRQILGTDFSRLGMNGRFTQAFIEYNGNNWAILLGRKKVPYFNKNMNSIIHNSQFPTYDQFRFSLNFYKFFGQFFAGQLGSGKLEQNRIKRFISGHSLKTSVMNNKIEIEIGELVIYTGENRSVEIFYLNPVAPYIFIQPDGDDLDLNNYNNDNLMIFFTAHYKLNQILNFNSEFIIDDFQYRDDPVQDMLGWKLGADGQLPIANYIINWESEYAEIDSWTYIHSGRGQFTTWQNRHHAIGYPYGGDLRSFRFQTHSWLKKDKLGLNVEYTWLEKGSNNIQTQSANSGTLSDSFPYPPVKVFHMFESSIIYHTKYASIQTGYTNIPFPYEIANGLIDELKVGLFFNLHLKLGYNIKLEQEQEI